MTKPAAMRKADVSRLVSGAFEGAIRAGLAVGTFKVVVEGNRAEVLPIAANAPSDDANELSRRMREAFGK